MKGIYKITNKINNKIYIGESLDILRRWKEHRETLAEGKHHNYKLQNDYNKYGAEAFKYELICVLDESILKGMDKYVLLYLESEAISYYNAISKGYNLENTASEIFKREKIVYCEHDHVFLDKAMQDFKGGIYAWDDKIVFKNVLTYKDLMKDIGVKKQSELSAILLDKGILYKDGCYKWNPKIIEWDGKYDKIEFTRDIYLDILSKIKC